MTTFYVGQRVRIVSTKGWDQLVGRETHITSIAPPEYAAHGYEWLIDISHNGTPLGACSRHLEPLTPSGHQPAELSVEELLPFLKGKRVQA